MAVSPVWAAGCPDRVPKEAGLVENQQVAVHRKIAGSEIPAQDRQGGRTEGVAGVDAEVGCEPGEGAGSRTFQVEGDFRGLPRRGCAVEPFHLEIQPQVLVEKKGAIGSLPFGVESQLSAGPLERGLGGKLGPQGSGFFAGHFNPGLDRRAERERHHGDEAGHHQGEQQHRAAGGGIRNQAHGVESRLRSRAPGGGGREGRRRRRAELPPSIPPPPLRFQVPRARPPARCGGRNP